jgi:glycosyltransferase involved in cell wall biosynthesis
MVLTLHDMIHDRFPELPAAKWEKKEKYTMANRANAIIVPSQFTADELMTLYNIPAHKIHVIYHGGPEWKISPEPLDPKRFLFVGTRTYYKNFTIVLEALKMVPESTLFIVGPPLSSAEKTLVNDFGINDRIKEINASDEELKKLYASSSALIFPSLMEGFGLPILEAFAANCPVICSDIPVFHEICGDAALYFNPTSATMLADTMKENIKQRFTENIATQRAKFNWQKCAAETLCVYKNVL